MFAGDASGGDETTGVGGCGCGEGFEVGVDGGEGGVDGHGSLPGVEGFVAGGGGAGEVREGGGGGHGCCCEEGDDGELHDCGLLVWSDKEKWVL